MTETESIEGHCNCGQVVFRLDCAVADVYVCHCSLCRRATGTMGVTVVVVPSSRFTWVAGQSLVRRWQMPGHDWECSFCTHCGSHLPGQNSSETTYVPAGSLDNGQENLKVKEHIWVSSKAPWHTIGDDARQNPEGLNST